VALRYAEAWIAFRPPRTLRTTVLAPVDGSDGGPTDVSENEAKHAPLPSLFRDGGDVEVASDAP